LAISDIAVAVGGGAVAAAGAYAMLVEQFWLRVREIELSFSNLPPAFDGFTILHLTDLHLTKTGLLEERLTKLVAEREVDACFITGDITADARASGAFHRICSVIRRREPIYAVLGNSEHKPWLDTDTLLQSLVFDGMEMLINSSAVIHRGSDSIAVVGVEDAYSRLDDLDAAFSGVAEDSFSILLSHCPSVAPRGIARGADLILAGHTHGGQVRLPFMGTIWTHTHSNKALNDGLYFPKDLRRFVKGDPGESVLFVNRGVGTSKLHIRFLCRPEIAYITLRRAERP